MVSGYSLCSVFMYLYVRLLTGKSFPALISALVFPLSGSMIAEMRHTAVIHSMFYMMAILFSIEKLSRSKSLWWLAAGIAAVGFCILNGHMQFVAYILSLAAVYAVFRALSMKDGQASFVTKTAIMIFAGLAIGAIQILPTWELTKFSVRSKFAFIDFLSYCCHPVQAIGLATPFVFGAQNSNFFSIPYFGLDYRPPHFLYVGLLPMITAFGAFLLVRRNLFTYFWMAIGTTTFLLSFGNSTPLAWLLYNVPPFGSFRALCLLYLIAAASFAIVCGLVLSKLMDEKLQRRRIIVFSSSFICLVWGLISLSVQVLQKVIELPERSSVEGNLPPFWENPAVLVPFYGSFLVLAAFLLWLKRPDFRWFQALLLTVVLADLGFVAWFGEWRFSPISVASMETPAHLVRYRDELKSTRQRLFPVRGVSGDDAEGRPNLSRLWDINSASAFGPLLNTRYLELLGITEGGFLPVPWTWTSECRSFDILAVKYLTVPHGDMRLTEYKVADSPIFKKVSEHEKADVFENTRALPRVWMVGETRLMADADIVRTLRRGEFQDGSIFEPTKLALISNAGMKSEGFVAPPKEVSVQNFSGNAKVVGLENAKMVVETDSASGGFLVCSDLFYPGWKSFIDGKPAELVRTDYVLRGVAVEAGKHAVEFRYEPLYLYVGIGISVLGSLFLAAVCWMANKKPQA